MTEFESCPEALRHDADRNGNCRWCGKRNVGDRALRPESTSHYGYDVTELDTAYRRAYDPDYGDGSNPYDT